MKFDCRPARDQKQHAFSAATDLAVIKIDTDNGICTQAICFRTEFIQSELASRAQAFLHRLTATTKGVSQRGSDVGEKMHPYDTL